MLSGQEDKQSDYYQQFHIFLVKGCKVFKLSRIIFFDYLLHQAALLRIGI